MCLSPNVYKMLSEWIPPSSSIAPKGTTIEIFHITKWWHHYVPKSILRKIVRTSKIKNCFPVSISPIKVGDCKDPASIDVTMKGDFHGQQ